MAPTRREAVIGALAIAAAPYVARARHSKVPNIVFIMADDLGWGDLGCYGNTEFETPALDALASRGVRLTQAYANSCVCSATRMALITGRYQYRLRGGLEEPIKEKPDPLLGLPPSHPTLPSTLKMAGYHTALIGKWHLGYQPWFGPLKSGYDEFFGIRSGGVDYFTHKSVIGKPDLWDGDRLSDEHGYLTDLLTERAVKYVRKRAARSDRPFLLSLHYTAPHWPWETEQDAPRAAELKELFDFGGGSLPTYAAMVRSLDRGVGTVLRALMESGLDHDTIVVFTSDNGGERYSKMWPLVGEKGDLLEGGIRVPTLIAFPSVLPEGRTSDQVAISMDWMATLLNAAGVRPVLPLDGIDLLPMLAGASPDVRRRLFWRFVGQQQAAVRDGSLKYLRVGKNEYLFDISRDPRERANLAAARPEELSRLRKAFADWNATMLPDKGVEGYVFGADVLAGRPDGD
jgi:arylsulfatase A-like enzyme